MDPGHGSIESGTKHGKKQGAAAQQQCRGHGCWLAAAAAAALPCCSPLPSLPSVEGWPVTGQGRPCLLKFS